MTEKVLEVDQKVNDLKNSIEEFSQKIEELTSKLEVNEEELKEKSVEFSVEEKLLLKDKESLLSKINNKDFISSYQDEDKEMEEVSKYDYP